MIDQTDLFQQDVIAAKFADFHERNPHVYQAIEARALRLLASGARRIGVKAIWESLRVDAALRVDSRDWRLNNNYTACYARLLIERHPQLADVIETRARVAA